MTKINKKWLIGTFSLAIIAISAFFVFWGDSKPDFVPVLPQNVKEIADQAIDNNKYVVAVAETPEVKVFLSPPSGVNQTILPVIRPSNMQSIPRPNFRSAGTKKIDENTLIFESPTYFGNSLRFLVLDQQGEWIQVLLPARPNGQTGWVSKSDVSLNQYEAVIQVDLQNRRLVAWVDGENIVDTTVSIGTPFNPTPTGLYYVTETIPQSWTGGPFGPVALATNAYSEELELFDGGIPVVAIHGTNTPNSLGEAESNGCLRIDNELVALLAERLPPGTPIFIW